jgi:hypothetical protein
VFKETKVHKAQLVLKAHKALKEILEPVYKVHKAQLAIKVHKAQLAIKVRKAQLVIKVHKVQLVLKVLRVLKVILGLKVLQVLRELWEILVVIRYCIDTHLLHNGLIIIQMFVGMLVFLLGLLVVLLMFTTKI